MTSNPPTGRELVERLIVAAVNLRIEGLATSNAKAALFAEAAEALTASEARVAELLKVVKGSANASRAAMGPQPHVAPEAEPSAAGNNPVSLARANTRPNWENCPSTHCNRREECAAPNDCTIKVTGRRALLAPFRAHIEEQNDGPLPNWPEDPYRWDERYGGLPYSAGMATAFRTFMAGWDAARSAIAKASSSGLLENQVDSVSQSQPKSTLHGAHTDAESSAAVKP